jgi:hypothetical protein
VQLRAQSGEQLSKRLPVSGLDALEQGLEIEEVHLGHGLSPLE